LKSETLTSKTIGLEIKAVSNWKTRFFSRIDRVLRRSLGVSETAATDETVKPAPPVDPKLPSEEELEEPPVVFKDEAQDDKPQIILPDDLKDKASVLP
jgi:heat shock protein beta